MFAAVVLKYSHAEAYLAVILPHSTVIPILFFLSPNRIMNSLKHYVPSTCYFIPSALLTVIIAAVASGRDL
jgi:hypothetical protein